MTEHEHAVMLNMLEMRREYLLQRASVVRSEKAAKAWREFADRDAARIATLRMEPGRLRYA